MERRKPKWMKHTHASEESPPKYSVVNQRTCRHDGHRHHHTASPVVVCRRKGLLKGDNMKGFLCPSDGGHGIVGGLGKTHLGADVWERR